MEPSNDYILLDTHAIGGPTGDYIFDPDIDSSDWLEFRIMNIANGVVGPSYVQISTQTPPTPLAWDGTKTVGNINAYSSIIYALGATAPPIPPSPWIRIVNQQGVVYIRIDTPANNAVYVSVQSRSRILRKVPAPFVTVRPEDEKLVHQERERRIQQAVLGQAGEEYAYAPRPIEKEQIIEPDSTGRQPATKLGYWGRILR